MDEAKKMALLALEALEEKKAEEVTVLDIGNISTLGDYFIIANGVNRNQVQAMADSVEEALGKAGFEPKNIEGYRNANWILLDYKDVVIHVFGKEDRDFYDLEHIWKDGIPVTKEDLMN